MVVIYTYDEQWNFLCSYQGFSESQALLDIPKDFKGWAVVQNDAKTIYHYT